MKQMIYQKDSKIELLDSGKRFGYEYYIMNLGTHPTAYIKVPESHPFYKKDYENIYTEFYVNGGLTYSEDHLWISQSKRIEGWFIGWDYAHYGDYLGFEEEFPEEYRTGVKRWTTGEIKQEVFKACRRLHEMEN